jgi:threonyl-tRNA synthetase
MLHRVLLGSLERFIGALIEHYNADFPLWLAPVQTLVIPIGPSASGYAEKVKGALEDAGLRVEIESSNETLNKRIRNAELQKIPYSLVIGEREAADGTVAVRKKGKGNVGVIALADFIKQSQEEINNKR